MRKLTINSITFWFTIVLILVGLISINSCNHKNSKKQIFVVLKSESSPFFESIKKGAEDNPLNYEILVRSGKDEKDLIGQMQIMQGIVNIVENDKSNIAGVILTPSSSGNDLIPYIKKLKSANIPLILVDTKIDSVLLINVGLDSIPYITSSNFEGGKQVGVFLDSILLPQSSILILNGVDGQESASERNKGFKDKIEYSPKKFRITERTANWNRQEALTTLASFNSLGKSFDAIFAANDEMALGAYQAVLNFKISPKPIIVGFDAIDDARLSIKNGGIIATIAQNPYKMGKDAIELLNKIVNKEPYNLINTIPTAIIKE